MSLPNEYSTSLATPLELATFAMGCFWKPEALLGGIEGVLHTRVGYAGGQTEAPSYWKLGDHLETVQVVYDPLQITFQQLLDLFFTHHSPTRIPWKRQYTSAVFFHSAAQQEVLLPRITFESEMRQQEVLTLALPFQQFYLAEDRHQKWYLQRNLALRQELESLYPHLQEFLSSTVAARLNAFMAGYLKKEEVLPFCKAIPLPEKTISLLLSQQPAIARVHCT